jgi:HCOMODA/2-hydroxy-3-carboxy-muconic semialdehyde decarboxylase
VVHSHSPTVVPFSVTNVPLKPIRAPFLYPEVPVFEIRDAAGWTNLLITNQEKGKALAETLGKNSVALLRGHGNVVVAPTIRMVVYRAIYTEHNALLLLHAKMLGGPINYLAPEEAAIMEGMLAKNQIGSGHGQDRTWDMWKAEAMGSSGKRRQH